MNALDKKELEALLKHGAYDLFREDTEGNGDADSEKFKAADIEEILRTKTKTVVVEAGGEVKSSSFAKAR
jgi:hypothetical protein